MGFSIVSHILSSGSTNPFTLSYNNNNGKILFLGIVFSGSTFRTGGTPTFNGVNFTYANSGTTSNQTGSLTTEMWYNILPYSGVSNISIPNTLGREILLIASSFDTTGSGFQFAGANSSVNSIIYDPYENHTTSTTDKSYLNVDIIGIDYNQPTGWTGTIIDTSVKGSSSYTSQYHTFESSTLFIGGYQWDSPGSSSSLCTLTVKDISITPNPCVYFDTITKYVVLHIGDNFVEFENII